MKKCVLSDKICTECGECDRCDLDPNKICDNCCECISVDKDYETIIIDKIIMDPDDAEDQKDASTKESTPKIIHKRTRQH